mmetsp:Transcript_11815/g.25756  ORF Transcript_11815/g.25756 Transcript_11815/m.25756 type:complete len:446 (-) Transcript_11815:28-1365(-)
MSDDGDLRTGTPEPDPSACGGDGDEKEERTDEDRMLDGIAEQRGLIEALPGNTSEVALRRAPHEKKLGQLEFQYQILAEKKRLSSVLAKFEEEHGPLYSEPCLICLENIRVHASQGLMLVFICCGGFICRNCALGMEESEGLDKCPLCRESLDEKTPVENAAKLKALADRGVSWAQKDYGTHLVHGRHGFKKQGMTGLEWIKKSAAQNYPPALHELSNIYRKGMASVLRKSQEEANELLLKSANLGHVPANSILSGFYFGGTNGFEKNLDEFYFRSSVTLALDNTREEAARVLGSLHFFEHGIPEPSLYLACYYLNIVACEDDHGIACHLYSEAVLKLTEYLHDGCHANLGSNAVPAIMFWLRKSRDLGYEDEERLLEKGETICQSRCANCKKGAQAGEKFKQCSKCKAQWYCSKECQVEAWRAGHKKDCKRAAILKFEDYLNAE